MLNRLCDQFISLSPQHTAATSESKKDPYTNLKSNGVGIGVPLITATTVGSSNRLLRPLLQSSMDGSQRFDIYNRLDVSSSPGGNIPWFWHRLHKPNIDSSVSNLRHRPWAPMAAQEAKRLVATTPAANVGNRHVVWTSTPSNTSSTMITAEYWSINPKPSWIWQKRLKQ